MSFRDHIRKLKPAKSYISPLDKISDILSETLSGCPSETDSLVNRKFFKLLIFDPIK